MSETECACVCVVQTKPNHAPTLSVPPVCLKLIVIGTVNHQGGTSMVFQETFLVSRR